MDSPARRDGPAAPWPRVGVIYLTFPRPGAEREVDRAMRAFERLAYPREALELICVESRGPRAPLRPWFERAWGCHAGRRLPRISYVRIDAVLGFAGNTALGAEIARALGCAYVWLVNQDAAPAPDALRAAVACAEADPRVGAVQSLLLLGDQPDRINSCGNRYHVLGYGFVHGCGQPRRAAPPARVEIGYASGAAVLVRLAAAPRPLFDPRLFGYHEDTDLSWELRLRGWRVVLEPRSVVWHWYEFRRDPAKWFWLERNRWVLLLTYYPWLGLLALAPLLAAFEAATAAVAVREGWWPAKARAWAALMRPATWRWIAERRRRLERLAGGDRRALLAGATTDLEAPDPRWAGSAALRLANTLTGWYWRRVRRWLA
jgi:GT2 family glycosyltransferase